MSNSINYALLFSTPYSSPTDNILNTLYGGGSTNSLGAANPLQALQSAETNQTKDISTTAQEPQVARDIATFNTAVMSAKTPAALLQNPTVMKVLLTANGMSDQIPFTALTQKALLSNLSDPKSLANQLNATDSRWKPVVSTYNFATQGLAVIQQPSVLSKLANAYAEVTWRQSLDATTPGLSNALSFRAQASTVTSVDQILGDPVLRDVVTTALNIPLQIAFQDIPAQEKAISTRLDITKLKDPHFVDTFTQEYLLNKANAANPSTSQPSLDQLASQANGLVV